MPKIRIGMPATYAIGEADREQRDGGAEVRLARDEEERHRGERAGDQRGPRA